MPRVAILHQGCVPNYREPFFRRLAALGARQYVVFYGDPEPESAVVAAQPPYRFDAVFVRNRWFRVFGRRMIYQPVFRRVAFGGFDALVVGHEVKYVANLALLAWFRLLGKPVLFWGFGSGQDAWDEGRGPIGKYLTRLVNAAKGALARLASGYLVYTESGAATLTRAGMKRERISVLDNTIDLDDEIAQHARALALDRAALRHSLGVAPDATVLAFVGRLLAEKKVEELIAAARSLRADGVEIELVIVGAGPQRGALEKMATGASWCHFLGPIHDSESIARIYRASDALVIPGYVGLAVNRAFAHGVPVITIASPVHSPEIDYVEDGGNGLILAPADFVAGLKRFAGDAALRDRLALGALHTRDRLDLARMITAFDDGVAAALARSRRARLRERAA
jgi:glycosyltransferase involved in cell wall biosynthesis